MMLVIRRIDFGVWLFEQRKRDDSVGTLASNAFNHWRGDWSNNKTMLDCQDCLKKLGSGDTHLEALGSHDAAQDALEQAWWEYVSVLARDKARDVLLREIAATIERGLKDAEDVNGESKYIIDKDCGDLLQKLTQKLKEM
ncbi:MAG: hypothetical protein ACXQT4_02270 [Methanotrichaceae archaeon]